MPKKKNGMNQIKHKIVVLGIAITVLCFYLILPTPYGKDIQNSPVIDAKPEKPNFGWWEKGIPKDSATNEWDTYANMLRDQVPKDPMLREVFVDVFGNSYNNTMFVVLTVINETIVQKVLMLINAPEGVHIKFWKGMAPEYKLDEWIGKIHLSELRERGVPCTVIGKTENGTILIGLAEVKPEYVEIVQNYVKDMIPLNVIVIRVLGEPVLECYNHRQRPLEAGVEVGAYKNATHIYVSTLEDFE
jgi:hypothetical protein